MKVIIPAMGSRGDVFPVVSLGKEIKERGDSVVIITAANYRQVVEEAGLDYVELCDAQTYDAVREALEKYGISAKRNFTRADYNAIDRFFDFVPSELFRLVERNQEPGNTVLASGDLLTLGLGCLVQEKLGIPYVAIRYPPGEFKIAAPWFPLWMQGFEYWLRNFLLDRFWITKRIRKAYDDFRSELGLPPETNFARAMYRSESLNLCLFPAWFIPWYKFNMHNTIITHFPLYEYQQDEPLPAHLERFLENGEPPVVFIRASWERDPQAFFASSLRACKALGIRAVFLTDLKIPGTGANDNVCVCEYASLKRLLPRSAAIVHHGGMGTIARAMAEATPQLLVYRKNRTDVGFNASQVVKLGVGLKVLYSQYNRNPDPILGKLLNDGAVKRAATQYSRQFAEPQFGSAIGMMRQLLASKPAVNQEARTPAG